MGVGVGVAVPAAASLFWLSYVVDMVLKLSGAISFGLRRMHEWKKRNRVNYTVVNAYSPGDEIIVNKQHATVQRVRGKTVFYTIDATGEEGSFH